MTAPSIKDFLPKGYNHDSNMQDVMQDNEVKLAKVRKVLENSGIAYGTNLSDIEVQTELVYPVIYTTHNHESMLALNPVVFLAQHRWLAHYELYVIKEYDNHKPDDCSLLMEYIMSLPRPCRFLRLRHFCEVCDINIPKYYESLAYTIMDIYTDTEIFDCEFANSWAEFISHFADAFEAYNKTVCDNYPEELKQDHVTLYHGREYDDDVDYLARAWTLNKSTAEFFAKRFVKTDGKPRPYYEIVLTQAEFNKLCTFYTDSRGEAEAYFVDGFHLDLFRITEHTIHQS